MLRPQSGAYCPRQTPGLCSSKTLCAASLCSHSLQADSSALGSVSAGSLAVTGALTQAGVGLQPTALTVTETSPVVDAGVPSGSLVLVEYSGSVVVTYAVALPVAPYPGYQLTFFNNTADSQQLTAATGALIWMPYAGNQAFQQLAPWASVILQAVTTTQWIAVGGPPGPCVLTATLATDDATQAILSLGLPCGSLVLCDGHNIVLPSAPSTPANQTLEPGYWLLIWNNDTSGAAVTVSPGPGGSIITLDQLNSVALAPSEAMVYRVLNETNEWLQSPS